MQPQPKPSGDPRSSSDTRELSRGAIEETTGSLDRCRVDGKFFLAGEEKLFVRGVTYGTFGPGADDGCNAFPRREIVERDLVQMSRNGVNAVRVYTVPPPWLLDQAAGLGLRVMVGIPWEQHIDFLDGGRRAQAIERRVGEAVEACAGHPGVLCYAVGNEIPPSIVRWAGYRRVERHIRRLYDIAKSADPGALVTYANFPSTEYLNLPFLDLACFNVYLEEPNALDSYLARLQNLAGDRPLLIGEIGLDSRRNGQHGQARSLYDQLRITFAGGCAGAFVFSWTDEWHRGGQDIRDWDFGLTGRNRSPKVALPAVRRAFVDIPFPAQACWPRVSVVVCVYNGDDTLADCLDGLAALEYPDYEVIVVDDGSTDRSAEIADRNGVRLIRTTNRGLSAARNTGLDAASGEIVAFIDADARPDPHWLHYLCEAFRDEQFVGIGGPNLPARGDGEIAASIANAPGGPIHVLLSDREAEHIPGCNMAFRREALRAIGGFDRTFRVAGDDVDICWQLQERGWKLGFSPAAVVWHHQRSSVSAYWKQQRGYGRAEALLEIKWPAKYNAAGQVAWSGRIYAQPLLYSILSPSRVYHGTWGTAPFQSRHPRQGLLASLAATPEWYLLLATLSGLSLLGLLWKPLLLALPLLAAALATSLLWAGRRALTATYDEPAVSRWESIRRRLRVAFLSLIQPPARLHGRLAHGLTPWRFRRVSDLSPPWPRQARIWSERWRDTAHWLGAIEKRLKRERAVVQRGGPYDRWDLQVRDGACSVIRLRMCLEDHERGRQLLRFRVWPWPAAARLAWLLGVVPAVLSVAAAVDEAWLASGILAGVAGLFTLRLTGQTGSTTTLILDQLHDLARGERDCVGLDEPDDAAALEGTEREEATA